MRTASRIPAKAFAGGQHFETRFGHLATANITPDRETGLASGARSFFRKELYDYKPYAKTAAPSSCQGRADTAES
jgi:hypothetical protein